MEPEWLRGALASGRSIRAIAADAGCDPSTVAYWANKYGFSSVHRPPRARKSEMDETRLRRLVEQGLSVREIAVTCSLSPTAVRYWLRRFELRTQPSRYARRDGPKPHELLRECRTHGWTVFRRMGRAGGYRCSRCTATRVADRRRRVKEILVAEAGGACRLCGYDRYAGALHFHHPDPEKKRFQLAERGMTRSLSRSREEAKQCVLLCANCHAEVESGLAIVAADDVAGSGPG